MIKPNSNGNNFVIPPSNKIGSCLPKYHQDPRLVMKLVKSDKSPHGYEVIDTGASLSNLGLSKEYLLGRVCKSGTAEHSVKRAILREERKAA
jgi:hypothetical protein